MCRKAAERNRLKVGYFSFGWKKETRVLESCCPLPSLTLVCFALQAFALQA